MDEKKVDLSRLNAIRFEEDLEAAVKRYDPADYAAEASKKLCAGLDGTAKISTWRPHHLIHSMEACCAYHRRGRADPVTRDSLAKVMNVYHEHSDPHVMHLLTEEQKLAMALRIMASQQFPFQYRPMYHDFARPFAIFVYNDPMPKTAQSFETKYGLHPRAWMELCYGIFALVQDRRPPIFQPSQLLPLNRWTEDQIESFVSLSTRTTEEIRDQYRTERAGLKKPYLSGLLRSGFIERPIMALGDDWYLVSHDGLMFRHAGDGLLRLCRDFDPPFGNEIGDSFERYVHAVLKKLDCDTLLTSKQIEQLAPGRSCDFIAVRDDCLLLVECKAVSLAVQLLTEGVLRGDNSTTKIVDATKQLLATIAAIQDGSLDSLLDAIDKPIFGAVVTYGDIFMANSPWYRSDIIGWALQDRGVDVDELNVMFARPLQAFSIEVLEKFVLAADKHERRVVGLIEDKEDSDYVATGDWEMYLNRFLEGTRLSEMTPLREAMEAFYKEVLGKDADIEP